MNVYFYEAVARDRLHDIQQQAELRRLAASGRESRPGRLRPWWERLHFARTREHRHPVVAGGADRAG